MERLAALVEAYVELARSHHAHCEVMFRTDVIDPDDVGLQAAGLRAYEVLESTVREIIERDELDVSLDDATWLCWSAMQGLVVIGPKIERIHANAGGGELSTRDLVHWFTDLIVDGLRSSSARG